MTACSAWSEADLLLKEEKAAEDVRSRPFQLPSRRRVLSKAAGTNAGELTTAPAIIVGPDTPLHDAARTMRERGVRRLVVVDDDHRVVGIVSRIDLLKAYMRDDAATKSDVEAIVRDVLWLRDISLEMHVKGGVVSIDGKVGRKSNADLIASLARRLAGVVEVHAGTDCTPPGSTHAPCDCRAAPAAWQDAAELPPTGPHPRTTPADITRTDSPVVFGPCTPRDHVRRAACGCSKARSVAITSISPGTKRAPTPGMMASASSSGAKRVLRAAITAPTIATPERTANTA